MPTPRDSSGHLPPGVRAAAIDLLADGSLTGRWTRHWRERPAWPQLQDIDGTWISSAELEQRTRLIAERLRAAGLTAGERLVLSGGASAQFVIAYIAALRAGLVVVPANAGYKRPEVQALVRAARPAAAVVDDRERATWIAEATDAQTPVWNIDLAQTLPPHDGVGHEIDRAGAADPALMIFTSGTTGRPKGALISHGNLLCSATAVELAWRWQPDDRLLLVLPLFHVHGLGVGLNGSLCAGAAVVLRPRFDVADLAERARGVSMFFGVPAMYGRIAAAGSAAALRSLRLLVSGSAPLPAALADEIAAGAGQVPLERYGMTETMMLTSNPYDGPRRPGTVGFPLPGVELRLAETGEIEVRGASVIAGYYENPHANAEAFTADGWFKTGDLGELTDEAYLRIVGRAKELIITGGYNVYPREVEEVLDSHPAVREVAVIGRPSEDWGETVTAVVVAARPVSSDDLRAHAAEQLASYKVPKRIEFIEQLPRNAMGKIVRGDL